MPNQRINPQYQMIARDIAKRITDNEWTENQMISGRSLLSSEYKVSPETIRRALALLVDMKVVYVKKNSGVNILSKDNAKRYLSSFDEMKDQMDMQSELKDLIEKNDEINREMHDLLAKIIKLQSTILYSNPNIPYYEIKVSSNSNIIGKNIKDIKFWQKTEATIIAIRRGKNLIISPGPKAEIYENDTVVIVGSQKAAQKAADYINGKTSVLQGGGN
ncbi:MAG: TrkA C-terminal domain-containing protein [Clostridia bacterium]|jgi:K+/H+ antiporter YhaU regulatory subunit KhtT|nr:TrkA C-terminal domain-containing protein [Clostridia bacterium]MDD3972338.1 TrkA C-terminal domain-containing protein [Clostridia bacterium]